MTKENIPEFTVTTLSQSIRNTLETEFEYVMTYSNSVSNVFRIDWDRVVTVNSGMFSFVIAFRSQLIFISLYNHSYEYHDRKGLERE